jgi:nicotinamidase-related amidase
MLSPTAGATHDWQRHAERRSPKRMPEDDSALLVMDVQPEIVERFGDETILEPLGRAIGAARTHGVLVVYVKIGFRPGYPEVSPRNARFAALSGSGAFLEDASRVHPAIAPQPGDVEVTKKRVSAFTGSDLELVLRSRGIRTMVLTGIATSGVVLSTLREAADLDYDLTVLEDGCRDADPEVHRVLLEKVFPRQSEVIDVETWVRRLDT